VIPVATTEGGSDLELTLVAILAAVTVLFLLAYRTRVPYPIWLSVGGAVLGFAPGMPEDLRLDPDLVLVLVLPPLLYSAAFFSDLRALRQNVRPIGLLAVGLVLATTLAVGALAHWVFGLPWAVALVLGAVLGPTDPVAATAIAGRVGAPKRIVTVLEGESLVNDSTALIAFRFAVGAATAGTFSLVDAAGEFVLGVAGGVAIGVAVGAVVAFVRRRVEDVSTEAVLSLATPYFAYLPADALELSGVVAAVTSGIYLGWRASELTSPSTRQQLVGLWQLLVFALNSLLFVLVGLTLPSVLEGLEGEPPGRLALYAVLTALTVMAVRFAWVFPLSYAPRLLSRRIRERDPLPPWQQLFVTAFTGMRGAVSLAAALSIPPELPGYDLVLFLTFTTIAWTLVLQGLLLPGLLRVLGVRDDGSTIHEEDHARLVAADAALLRLDELEREPWVRPDTVERLRGQYRFRQRRFRTRLGKPLAEDGLSLPLEEDADARSRDYQRLVRDVLDAQRDALLSMRREGRIGDDTLRRVERDLDLEDIRLDLERTPA
jgi:CPA1 family monovalent cation:H+ antiporter